MLLRPIKRIVRSIQTSAQTLLGNLPKLPLAPHHLQLQKIGSEYGGWTFADLPKLHGSTIISCGLGEDASFDVEFAARYGARVVLVDPTPGAIKHFEAIQANIGSKSTTPYSTGGAQPISAYDLSTITTDNLELYRKALWNETKSVSFFLPRNHEHISHSIVNFQNEYRSDTESITVPAVTLDLLMRELNLTSVPLLKLDIEGAEIEVILDMLAKRILPNQLLVEYDELSVPSKRTKVRVQSTHDQLLRHGYQLVHFDYPSNFLYVKLA
jgi:FkbM family methyltransferase